MISLSIVILTYNERDTLVDVVSEAVHYPLPEGWSREVIIVDDGSTDGSSAIADRIVQENAMVRVVHHDVNRGLGQGYRTGFESAGGRWITFLPADGQYRMTQVIKLIDVAEACDLVLGVLAERRDSFAGKMLSSMERQAFALLFGSPPPFQGIFLAMMDMVKSLPLLSTGRGWGIVLEMILRADRAGYQWRNVQLECEPRRSGNSKVNNIRTIAANLKQLFILKGLLRHSTEWRDETGR